MEGFSITDFEAIILISSMPNVSGFSREISMTPLIMLAAVSIANKKFGC